jgi:hypothetical protein
VSALGTETLPCLVTESMDGGSVKSKMNSVIERARKRRNLTDGKTGVSGNELLVHLLSKVNVCIEAFLRARLVLFSY